MAVALEDTKVSLDGDLKAEVASALALIEELSAKSSDSGLSEETCWELFGGPCPEALRKKIRNLEQDAPTKEDSEVFYSVTDMPQMEIIKEAKEEEEPGKHDAIEQRPTKKMSSKKRGSVEQKDILSERESPNTRKFTKERRSVDKDGLIDNEESGRKDLTDKDLALLEKYVCHCKERSEYLTDKDLAFLEKYMCRCKENLEQNKTSNLLSSSNEKHVNKEFLEKISSKEEKSSRKSDVSKEINLPKEEPTGGLEKELRESNFKDGKSSEKSVAISSKEEKPSRKSDVSKETNVSQEEQTGGLEKETHENNVKDGKSSEKSVAISSKKEKPSRKSNVSKETNVSKEEQTEGLEKETHESNVKDGKSSEKSVAISSIEEKPSRKSNVSKETNVFKEEQTGGLEKETHESNIKDGKSSEKSLAISSKEEKPSRKSNVSKETNVSKEEQTGGLEKETHESNVKDGKLSEKSVAISSKDEKPSRKSNVSKETNVSKEEQTGDLEKETHESNVKDGKSSEKSVAISSKEEKRSRKSDVSRETNVSKEQPTEKENHESNSKDGKAPKRSDTSKETASFKEIGIPKEQRLSKESKTLEEKYSGRKYQESKDNNKSSKMESESPNTKIIDSNTSKGGAEKLIRVEKLDESIVKTNGSKSTANNASLSKHSTDSRQGQQSKDKSEFISIGTATSLQATASKSSNTSRTKTKELLTTNKSIGSEKIMSTDKNQQTKISKVKNMYTSVSTISVPKEVKEKTTEVRASVKADTCSSESTIVSEVPKRKHRYSKSDSNNNSKCSCVCCIERQIRKSYKKDVGSCRCCKKEAVRCQCCIQSSKSSGEKCQIKLFNEDEPFINQENFKKSVQITSFNDNRNGPAVCNKRMQTSTTRIFGESGREFPDQYKPYSFNPLYMDPAYSRLIYSQKAPRPQPIRKPKTNQESHGYVKDFKSKSISREWSEKGNLDEYHKYPKECDCNGSESHEDNLLERSVSEAFRKSERQNSSTATNSESNNSNYRQHICRPQYPKYNDYKLPPVRPKTDICSCCSKPKAIIKKRPNVPTPPPCNCCNFKIKYT